jgi:PAS domain S-box-containing protein
MSRRRLIAYTVTIAILFGLLFWVLDGILYYTSFRNLLRLMIFAPPDNLRESILTAVPPYNLFVRMYVIVISLIGGMLAASFMMRQRRAETALRESEEKYRLLAETATDIILIHDMQGHMTYINSAGINLTGYSAEELGTFNIVDLTSGRYHAEIVERNRKRVAGNHGVYLYEVDIHSKTGKIIPLEVNSTLIMREGKPDSILLIARDITERKRVENAEREQRAFAEALAEVTATVNSTLDYHEVMIRIIETIESVIPNHHGTNIMLLEAGGATQIIHSCGCYARHGYSTPTPGTLSNIRKLPLLASVLDSKESLVIADTKNSEEWRVVDGFGWIRSYAAAPILIEGEVVGFLNIDSATPGYFNETHATRLKAFADQAAIALKNARLYRELETYSESLEQAVRERTIQFQQAKERIETILDNTPDVIMLLDKDGNVETCNPALNTMFRIENTGGYIGQPPWQFVDNTYVHTVQESLQRVLSNNKVIRLEVIALRNDGSHFDAEMALAPVRQDNRTRNIVCTIRDISLLKEVGRMKDSFLSIAAHELRTPLSSVMGFSEILLTRDLAPERHRRYLQIINDTSLRLNDIINNMLDISRLESGKGLDIQPEPFDIGKLITELLTYYQEAYPDYIFKLADMDESYKVIGDRLRLESVIRNLISNAIKYSGPGRPITVSCAHADGHLKINVEDTGIGITREQQKHLFEKFYRADPSNRSVSGTGLGLAICKLIVEGHGGEIGVESEEGKGSTFYFSIPAA